MAIEVQERYCPICGRDVSEPAFKRFGEWACSEEHAEAYVREVRAGKVEAAARRDRPEPREEASDRRGGCCC